MSKNSGNLRFFLGSAVLATTTLLSPLSWADGPAVPAGTPTAAPQQPGVGSMLVPFAAMFAVVYFLMIRPQQKKMKEQQDMLSALKQGDEVLTSSGILGKVAEITDKIVTLEIANNVRIKMLKSQVSQVIKGQIKDLA
jgi:preprotein translocase subunit YajC